MKQFLPKLSLLISFSFTAILCHAQAGTLDSSFGVNGKTAIDFGNIFINSELQSNACVAQPDGKIVIVGRCMIPVYSGSIAVVRLKINGTPDSSFGKNGKVDTYFDSTDYSGVNATSVLIQPDGKILVGGYKTYPGLEFGNFILARYLTNGNLDSTFGINGKVLTDVDPNFNPEAGIQAIALQKNGKILAGGFIDGFCLIQYMPNGSIDSSFGVNGRIQVSSRVAIFDLKVQNDGKIVVADGIMTPLGSSDFEVIRFLANGNYDSTFGNNGSVVVDFNENADPASIAILPNSKILVAGYVYQGFSNYLGIMRLTSNGALDSSFANNGKQIYFLDTRNPVKILTRSDGKFLASTTQLTRFNYNGTIDSSFGINGNALNFIGSRAALLQTDGKVVVTNSPNFTVARYRDDSLLTANLQRNISLAEGNSGTTPAQFRIVLNRPSAYDVQVNYTTINGSAVSGSDYVAASGKAVIKAGKTSKAITVNVIGDNVKEKNEKFALVIGNPVNALLGANDTATCTILNDDPGFTASAAGAVSADTKTAGIKLYPNPAKDLLRIEGLDAFSKTNISITDMNGNIVLRRSVTGSNASLNIQQLAAGVYEVKIETAGKMQSVKFVKE